MILILNPERKTENKKQNPHNAIKKRSFVFLESLPCLNIDAEKINRFK